MSTIITPTKTGNVAVDMITAGLRHYKLLHRRVDIVYVCPLYWILFSDYVKEKRPDFEFSEAIEFNDVTIMKGHSRMNQRLQFKLKVNAGN